MNVIEGDLIQLIDSGEYDVLVHGCNCFCNMGAGFAFYLKNKYPQILESDQKTIVGDKSKLGSYSKTILYISGKKMIILNAYTQYHWKGDGVLVDYNSIRNVFLNIKNEFHGKKIIYPRIGAGLARGDWNKIKSIINKELFNENHYLVEYKKSINSN
ncbi:phosphatase [Vibrio aestuarianus]|uniref:macro domain-containing protein n=1 Tax=Vibrio aestuarianus TaxID=28171 RepID=UPI001559B6C1|nr:macro domain-containing protein [Vibrio aestuarianus]NGZ14974.1 phosphatase [Vibrio aestuarianus]NKZ51122.1 phosphatase [Vibrio aestuarianus]